MRSLNVVVRRHQPFQFTHPEPEREGVDQVVGWSQKIEKKGKNGLYKPVSANSIPNLHRDCFGVRTVVCQGIPIVQIKGIKHLAD